MNDSAASFKSKLLFNARIIDPDQNTDEHGGLLIIDNKIAAIGKNASYQAPDDAVRIDCHGNVVAPGLVDMMVFTGEPGAEHKETLATASAAAIAGGVTTIITMPDTRPVIDDSALVDFIKRRARDTATVKVLPMAAITKNIAGKQLSEFALLREAGAVAFTDGRNSIASSALMRQAMLYSKTFDSLIVNYCLDNDLAGDGVMNEGEFATRLGLKGIVKAAEAIILDRDLRLVDLTGSKYHAALVSCPESLDSIRQAKQKGLDVSCSVSINHLSLNENDISDYRTFFKLSPPLRSEADRLQLIAGVADGTIDIIVSCHDPQNVENKRHPFAEAAYGAIGLETMLAAGLRLVHNGDITLSQLIRATTINPAKRLGLNAGCLKPGMPADCIVLDTEKPWISDTASLLSKSKNSPFENSHFTGKVITTIIDGEIVYDHDRLV